MCYSEFGDILDAIAEMDADVLSIETSRSKMELLVHFARFHYPNEVGPGVYHIHSLRVPTRRGNGHLACAGRGGAAENEATVGESGSRAKTRGWPEVEEALVNMVEAARMVRQNLVDHAP